MNIEEYRALKAKDAKEAEEGTQEIEQPEEKKEEENKQEQVEEETKTEKTVVEIDGEEVDIDELRNGYLRQSDYTKKTQKLANEKKEIEDALRFYNDVKNNPDAINSLRENVDVPRRLDPNQAHIIKLEEQLYDMKLDNDIKLMQSKYEDFEVREVLEFAASKEMTDLEDAYMLLKATSGRSHETKDNEGIDLASLKESLKKEIMSEMKSPSTGSIISTKVSGDVEKNNEIIISKAEARVAEGMGLSPKEYEKWRDANK